MSVLIETSLGTVVIDLYIEERPRCSLNFLKLCKVNFFNGCLFHSIQRNLVAQTGDPTGTGRGGSSIFEQLYGEQARFFDFEVTPKIYHKTRGLVSMVNNGNNQHTSQFFFTLAGDLDYLNNKHSVFGVVSEGNDFLSKINDAYCDKASRPYQNIRIHNTLILHDPFPDPGGLEIPEIGPKFYRSYEELDADGPPRIEEDEQLDDEGANGEVPESEKIEREAVKEAHTNAQLLTLLGDLPEVDAKPPENVLFVCRLNPVTRSEDLEIIFSRFGEILTCEVIHDRRSGNSLQYAFIEFDRKEDCEEAFFKMDNVIIDDRRIHVDFSQSVAKEWFKYRRDKIGNIPPPPPRSSTAVRKWKDPRALPSRREQPRHHRPRERPRYEDDNGNNRSLSPRETATPEKKGMEYLISDSGSDSRSTSPQKRRKKHHSKHTRSHERKSNHSRGHTSSKLNP